MESLYSRQKTLLRYLLEADSFKPVKDFAQILSCSDKTVRNDLNYWEKQGITIEKISGRGIRLSGAQKSSINEILSKKQDNSGLSAGQRRMKILFELLEGKQKRLSIQSLSDKYFVSKTSIVNDLSTIEDGIARYNLKLHKDVKGTALTGSETDIRRALVETINQFVKTKGNHLQVNCSRIDYDTLRELEQHFGRDKVQKIEKILEKTEDFLDYKIIEPYYINLITHILILVGRIQHNKTLYSEFDGRGRYGGRFYLAAKLMAQCIENDFTVSLNEAELFYIYQYLTSSGGIAGIAEDDALEDDACVREIAADIIEMSLKIYPLKFSFSQSLYKALLLHLRPMLNRIKYEIYIKNPILDEIKSEFPEAVLLLKLIMMKVQIKYSLPPVSEDETAYLAIYFQNAVEEIINKKNVVIVCSSGIGTSHLLEKRIKKYFPEWDIADVISAKQFEKTAAGSQIDLAVSTVRLNAAADIPVAYVSALFNEADAKNLRQSFMRQFPKVDHKDSLTEYFYEEEKTIEPPGEKCLAQCMINHFLYVNVYESGQPGRITVGVCPAPVRQGGRKDMNIHLPHKEDLSEDIIKKIYYWILENK